MTASYYGYLIKTHTSYLHLLIAAHIDLLYRFAEQTSFPFHKVKEEERMILLWASLHPHLLLLRESLIALLPLFIHAAPKAPSSRLLSASDKLGVFLQAPL